MRIFASVYFVCVNPVRMQCYAIESIEAKTIEKLINNDDKKVLFRLCNKKKQTTFIAILRFFPNKLKTNFNL